MCVLSFEQVNHMPDSLRLAHSTNLLFTVTSKKKSDQNLTVTPQLQF